MIKLIYLFQLYLYSFLLLFKEKYLSIKRWYLGQKIIDSSKFHKDLKGCVCLIVGAAKGGIGNVLIEKISRSNCYLIITVHGHNIKETKSNLINNQLKDVNPALYRFEYLDLISFDSIIQLTKKLNDSSQKINFFIFNAGVALREYYLTEDGFESQLQINYLSGCLLLNSLFPLIVKTAQIAKENNEPKSKIVFTSSNSHKIFNLDLNLLNDATDEFRQNFSTHLIYPTSKLFQLMFNLHFAKQMIKKKGLSKLISFVNVHPGICDTHLFDESNLKKKAKFIFDFISILLKTPEEGATNVSAPILSKEKLFDSEDCLYLEDLQLAKMNESCYDDKLKKEVYEKTLKLLKLNIVS